MQLPVIFPGVAQMPRSLFAWGAHAMEGQGGMVQALPPGLKGGAYYLPDIHLLAQLPPGGVIGSPWR